MKRTTTYHYSKNGMPFATKVEAEEKKRHLEDAIEQIHSLFKGQRANYEPATTTVVEIVKDIRGGYDVKETIIYRK